MCVATYVLRALVWPQPSLGPHERTKCVRCKERHDTAVEIERNPKIKARHDVRQEGRACLVMISFYFYSNVMTLVTTDAFCVLVWPRPT
jgi:hypothetical protein